MAKEKYFPDPDAKKYKIILYAYDGSIIKEFFPVSNVTISRGRSYYGLDGWATWEDWVTGKEYSWRNGPILVEEIE